MIPFEDHNLTICIQGPKSTDIKIYVGMTQIFTIKSIKFKIDSNTPWFPEINVSFSFLSTAKLHKNPYVRDNQITLVSTNFITNGTPPSAMEPPNVQLRLGEKIIHPIKEVELIAQAEGSGDFFFQLTFPKEKRDDLMDIIKELENLKFVNIKFI